MKQKSVLLGRTGIVSGKNAFGALPIQRDDPETATALLQKAYRAGFTFFDTARAYTDSEEKIGNALSDVRKSIVIATKTAAQTPEAFRNDLAVSLKALKTDYIDIYQFHNPSFCPMPGDGSGLYEEMLRAKKEGKIRFIGLTNHRLSVAEEAVQSGLYDTLQFPFCYLATEKDIRLVRLCQEKNVGFLCMKGLSGGLITNASAAYAYLDQYENALPIWGIQRESELDEFISFIYNAPEMTPKTQELIRRDREELVGEFCRSCGYCMPCPMGIVIPQCARMSQLIRRSPSAGHLDNASRQMMEHITACIGCRRCVSKCPYELNIPALLQKNLADYRGILDGTVRI